MSRGSKAHERCVTRGSIFRFHSPGKRDYLEITTQDPGIIILGSQLTGLARLS